MLFVLLYRTQRQGSALKVYYRLHLLAYQNIRKLVSSSLYILLDCSTDFLQLFPPPSQYNPAEQLSFSLSSSDLLELAKHEKALLCVMPETSF